MRIPGILLVSVEAKVTKDDEVDEDGEFKIEVVIPQVGDVDEYDIIVKIEAEDFEKLGNIVVNSIRSIEGVIDTKTLTGTKF